MSIHNIFRVFLSRRSTNRTYAISPHSIPNLGCSTPLGGEAVFSSQPKFVRPSPFLRALGNESEKRQNNRINACPRQNHCTTENNSPQHTRQRTKMPKN